MAILGRMSTPTQAVDLRALPAPEVNRRPRRRRGLVLLLAALGCLAIAGLFTAWLFSDEVANALEGLLAMGIMLVGGTALLLGIGLLVWGVASLRPRIIRQAAWLEDPSDRTHVRWWDGWAWTAHTSPRDPAVVALEPLRSGSGRRHRQGLALLVGGVVVAVGAELLRAALFEPPTYAVDPSSGAMQQVGSGSIWAAVGQVSPFAAIVAVIGLYLLLTLDDEPRAGWRTDPLDPARTRWWDGLAWTELTADAATDAAEPAPS